MIMVDKHFLQFIKERKITINTETLHRKTDLLKLLFKEAAFSSLQFLNDFNSS